MIKLSINNTACYLRDPEQSTIGKAILKNSVELIHQLGFEHFTFKKLANLINTTEATIYRYFENKHMLLLYLNSWYWSYLYYLIELKAKNVKSPKLQLDETLKILTNYDLKDSSIEFNLGHLCKIYIVEGSKAYLIKEVDEINKSRAYESYKVLAEKVGSIIKACNPKYAYPHSLASTLLEMAHLQEYFSQHLPRLTDKRNKSDKLYTYNYLKDFTLKAIN